MDRSMGLIAVVALLLALSVGACGGSSGGAPSSVLASSGPDSTAASSGLFGTYELTLAEGHDTEAADVPPGRWLITLTPGEAYLDSRARTTTPHRGKGSTMFTSLATTSNS